MTERSATDWQTKGGISYENAKRLAKLFEVDVDYVWRGTENETPDPFAGAEGSLEERLADLADQLASDREDREASISEVKALLQTQNENLAAQTKILDELKTLLAMQQSAAQALDREVQRTIERLQGAAPLQEPAAETSGPNSSPEASKRAPA